MSHELYFIPIIADALAKPEPKVALDEAFLRILDEGRTDPYRIGYGQFLQFMTCSLKHWAEHSPTAPSAQLHGLTADSGQCTILLERGKIRIGSLAVDRIPCRATFPKLLPGTYRLQTDAGWVLWEQSLAPRDLIWADAFPELDLPMAAQTEETLIQPTHEVVLLDGGITLRVFPGLEAGRLTLSIEQAEPTA